MQVRTTHAGEVTSTTMTREQSDGGRVEGNGNDGQGAAGGDDSAGTMGAGEWGEVMR